MADKRWVVKIGSSLLTQNGRGLDEAAIDDWTRQIAEVRKRDIEVIIVSSGAIAAGMQRLKWQKRPSDIHQLQAAAAVGQSGLIQTYESMFAKFKIPTAQVLLTHENLTSALRYENISATMHNLLALGAVPIINENDTVATDEIKFGDNDTLAALVANLMDATHLIILTDHGGIYDGDPRRQKNVRLIPNIDINDKRLDEVAERSPGSFGSGGMLTKILAARKVSEKQIQTHIVSGGAENVLIKISRNEVVGTRIYHDKK